MADGEQGELGLVGGAELLFDVVEVCADGGGGELQILGDSLYGGAAGEADEDLEFPLGQTFER